MHCNINDIVFEKIVNFLSQIKGIHIKNKRKIKKFINAIYYLLRTGCQYRFLPYYFGNWRAIHKRFKQWSDKEIWEKMFEHFKQDPDIEWLMIDSTIVRAHSNAAGYGKDSQAEEALGKSKGGFSTKIHFLTDALGNPLKFILTPGQRNDITQAEKLCESVSGSIIFADKAYDCDSFIESLSKQNCTANIPSKSNRKQKRAYDKKLYEERHIVECLVGKMKQFRRIFSRFDKAAQSYLSFLHFAGVLIWLR